VIKLMKNQTIRYVQGVGARYFDIMLFDKSTAKLPDRSMFININDNVSARPSTEIIFSVFKIAFSDTLEATHRP